MAVQSSPSQQPLEDHLRMGQNVNTETLSMSAPNLFIKSNKIYYSKVLFPKFISLVLLNMCFVITSEIVLRVESVG